MGLVQAPRGVTSKGMLEELDLEAYWDDLRVKRSNGGSEINAGLHSAATKATADLAAQFRQYEGKTLTGDDFAKIVGSGLQLFMRHWYEELRRQDSASLVGLVLGGQDMTPEELKGFIRALPLSLLKRIAKEGLVGGLASGTHALLAVEADFRENAGRDYELRRDGLDGKLLVTMYPARLNGAPLSFKLDEKFEVPQDGGVDR